MHKGLECLARRIKKKIPPLTIFDQIAYELKYIIEPFTPPDYSIVSYYSLVLYSSIFILAKKEITTFSFVFLYLYGDLVNGGVCFFFIRAKDSKPLCIRQ